MAKIKDQVIRANELSDIQIDENINMQTIIESLIEGSVAFNMLANHAPESDKQYFLGKRDELLSSAAFLTSLD
jgi:hypothetical protein